MSLIKASLDTFLNRSANALKAVEKTGEMLREGISPDGDLRNTLVTALDDVEESYAAIVAEAKAVGIVESRKPAAWYVDAVGEVEARKRRKETFATLREFVSVGSTWSETDRELEPFRQQATEKARVLRSQGMLPENSILAERTLIKALRLDNLASAEGMKILDEVVKNLSDMVARGVMMGLYSIGAHETSGIDNILDGEFERPEGPFVESIDTTADIPSIRVDNQCPDTETMPQERSAVTHNGTNEDKSGEGHPVTGEDATPESGTAIGENVPIMGVTSAETPGGLHIEPDIALMASAEVMPDPSACADAQRDGRGEDGSEVEENYAAATEYPREDERVVADSVSGVIVDKADGLATTVGADGPDLEDSMPEEVQHQEALNTNITATSDDSKNEIDDSHKQDVGSDVASPLVCYPAGNPKIIDKTPEAFEVKQLILKMPIKARTTLALLSHVGACDIADAARMTRACFGKTASWAKTQGVKSCVTLLDRAGLACLYEVDDRSIVSLTDYGAACVALDEIRSLQKGRSSLWNIPPVLGAPTTSGAAEAESLAVIVARSSLLADLLAHIAKNEGNSDAKKTLRHARYNNGLLLTPLLGGDATIAVSTDDLLAGDTERVLTIAEMAGSALDLGIPRSSIYIIKNGVVTACNIDTGDEDADGASFEHGPETARTAAVPNGSLTPEVADGFDKEAAHKAMDLNEEPGLDFAPPSAADGANEIQDRAEPKADDVMPTDVPLESEDSFKEYGDLVHRCLAIIDGSFGDWEDDRDRIGMALTLAKSISFDGKGGAGALLYKQLAMACDSGPDSRRYTMNGINDAFGFDYGESELGRALMLCTYLRAMFDPDGGHNHDLFAAFDMYANGYEETFGNYPELKDLYLALNKVHGISHKHGFTKQAIDSMGDRDARRKRLEDLSREAKSQITLPVIKPALDGIPEFIKMAFGEGSFLMEAMRAIVDDDINKVAKLGREASKYVGTDLMKPRLNERERNDYIDASFKKGVQSLKGSKKTVRISKLDYNALAKARLEIDKRLLILCEWLSLHDTGESGDAVKALARIRPLVIAALEQAESDLARVDEDRAGIIIVRMCISDMHDRILGGDGVSPRYTDLLLSGLISLDDELMPIILAEENGIEGFEPWRRINEHMKIRTTISLDDALKAATKNPRSSTMYNLRQVAHIEKILGRKGTNRLNRDSDRTRAIGAANRSYTELKETLEIWFTYGKISEAQREELLAIAEDHQDRLYKIGDFALWRRMLECLQKKADSFASVQFTELTERYERCKDSLGDGARSELLTKVGELLEDSNYAVAEDLLNRFDSGVRDYDSGGEIETDEFEKFMSEEVFQPLYEELARARLTTRKLKTLCKNLIMRRHGNDWSDSQIKEANEFALLWPSNEGYTQWQIAKLFIGMGFDVEEGQNIIGGAGGIDHCRVKLNKTPTHQDFFSHPIKDFGTGAVPVLDVVVTHENAQPDTIVELVTKSHATHAVAILVDFHLDRTCRREVAEKMRKINASTKFLLIDRVLMLHLILTPKGERLPVLLKCTLPLTNVQPFTAGSSHTPDEMFCGRTDELDRIRDWNGPCFVYGGRQLGKTALLERTAALTRDPREKQYVALVDIRGVSEEKKVVEVIRDALNEEFKSGRKSTLRMPGCETLKELCNEIDGLIADGDVNGVRILIDEADAYLSMLSQNDYEGLRPMVALMRSRSGSFKFVLTGLHNVARASEGTRKNGILGQVAPPICITPLPPVHALELLRRPLLYLGYRVEYPHVETILTNTNYFPGLVQLFGYLLVKSMPSQFGRHYSAQNGNPPCPIYQEQLASIISDNQINEEIKKKFMLTLELDEHDRYMLIAQILAALYYDYRKDGRPTSEGIPWREVKRQADEYGFVKLAGETDESFKTLMQEMEMMGVLTTRDGGERYRIRRRTFLGYIGNYDEVYDALGKEETL